MAPEPVRLDQAIAELADAMGWYEFGFQHGIEHGRKQLEDEWRGTHEVSAAIARMIAERGSYADLCERRGEPERAAEHRRTIRERGIA